MTSSGSSSQPRRACRRQHGFTMVEALVALVILAIGLLGIAALYLDSLRAGRTAIYRTQAVNLAADIADRIRANRTVPLSYVVAYGGVAAPTSCDSEAAACSPAALAADDVFRWKQELLGTFDAGGQPLSLGALPEGDGSIEVTAGTPNIYVITIRWTETGQEAPATYTLRLET